MIAPQSLKTRTRLRRLVAAAILLAGVAVVSNYTSWRQLSARQPPKASPAVAESSDGSGARQSAQIEQLLRRLSQHPEDVAARFELAQLYFSEKAYSRALAELTTLQILQPNNSEVYLRRAMAEEYIGKSKAAEKSVRRALALNPRDEEAREWLGEVYLGEGRSDEALAVFGQCLKQKPYSYFALMGESQAYEQKLIARDPVALTDIVGPVEKAVQLNPENPWGVITLARMKFNYLLRSDEAEKLALRATRLDPQNAEPYILLAEIALHRPATPESLRQAGLYAYQAAQRDPRDARPPAQAGRALLLQNEPAEAARLLQRSVDMRSTPEAVYQLSLAYGRSGNPEKARHYGDMYQRWTEFLERRKTLMGEILRHPREPARYYRLAELYLKANAADPAEYWLRTARSLDVNDPRYPRMLAEVRRLRKSAGSPAGLPLP